MESPHAHVGGGMHLSLEEGSLGIFVDEFGDEFGDKFGDEFSESPNLVTN